MTIRSESVHALHNLVAYREDLHGMDCAVEADSMQVLMPTILQFSRFAIPITAHYNSPIELNVEGDSSGNQKHHFPH